MNVTAFKLEYEVCKNEECKMPVIIVAAGSSSRMNGIDKQLMKVAGIPVIARTLLAFERSGCISEIILVTREESVLDMQKIAEEYNITKLSDITVGGATRQESVMRGLERLAEGVDKVLVSDGARMLVSQKLISRCAAALNTHDGCLCAVKVNDTVKEVVCGRVSKTVDRTSLYLAQTPQGITVSLYKKAAGEHDISTFTDDASVLEAGGCDVAVVEGDIRNIKITTPDDIKLAELYLKED